MSRAPHAGLVAPAVFVLLFAYTTMEAGPLNARPVEKVPRLRIAASPYPNFLLHILPTGTDFGELPGPEA